MKTIISWDLSHSLTSETENVDAPVHGEMTLFRSVNHQISGSCPQAAILYACRNTISRTLQRNEIRFRTAARQRPEALWTVVQQIAQPANDAGLDHCRGGTVAPRTPVLIEHRSQRIRPNADRQRRRIELPEIFRAGNSHRVRSYVFPETGEYLL